MGPRGPQEDKICDSTPISAAWIRTKVRGLLIPVYARRDRSYPLCRAFEAAQVDEQMLEDICGLSVGHQPRIIHQPGLVGSQDRVYSKRGVALRMLSSDDYHSSAARRRRTRVDPSL